eukprot:TRINITY_DN610_c0_g2_i2.p1 TRINITY_DN610_c0_g2~~TRINITY_DN610_c0_g2_i2.p1  ORF type:complete len:1667 (+),score=555.77 TRINITY_DN610_c0_g2_i2:217-5001(+)
MAVVGEKALDLMLAFVERSSQCSKVAGDFIPILLEKSSGGKPAVCSKCTQILMFFIEAEQHGAVLAECIKNFVHKNAKLAQFTLQAVKEALRAFGPKAINPKPILKELANAFEHTDKKVRDEAAELSLEMYRWIGSSVMTHLESVKPIVKKEIEEKCAALPKEIAQPTRYLRSHKPTAANTLTGGAATAAEVAPAVDPLEFVEAADILSQLPANWTEQCEDKLWKTRKEALTLLVELSSKPKLASGSYSDVVSTLKKVVAKDANIPVVIEACRALTNLVTGLRKEFLPCSRIVLEAVLGRLKEKKNIADAAMAILDAMAAGGAIHMVDMQETISSNLNAAKTPQHKAMILSWLTRCLKSCTKQMLGTSAKPYGKLIVAQLDDSAGDVREAACAAFGEFARLIGERAVLVYIEALEKANKAMFDKVKTFFPSAVNAAATAATAAPTTTASAAPAEAAEPIVVSKPPTSRKPGVASVKADAPAAKPKPLATKTSTASKPSSAAAAAPAVPEGPSISAEQAEAQLSEFVAAGLRANLASKDWKERLAACENFETQVNAMSPAECTEHCEVIIRFLLEKTPGYSDVNALVCTKVFTIAGTLAKSAAKVSGTAARVIVTAAYTKLNDAKVKAPTAELFSTLCQKVTAQHVFSILYKEAANHKTPLITASVAAWMTAYIQERGMATIKVPELITFLKICLESTNPKVKSNAIEVLVEIRKRKGTSVRDFLSDVKPALLTAIDAEFAKVANEPVPADPAGPAAAAAADDEPLEAPRADISAQLTNELIAEMGDANWKLRSGALERIRDVLTAANNRIQPKVGELLSALKQRMQESNKNILQAALMLVAQLATAMGKSIDKHVHTLAHGLMQNWCDNKKTIRDAATAALDAIAAEAGFDQFFGYLPGAMAVDAPMGRKDALSWMIKFLPAVDPKQHDVQVLIKPILVCLEDKSGEVRQAGVPVVEAIAKLVGSGPIFRAVKELKQGSQSALAQYMEPLRAFERDSVPAEAPVIATATAAAKKPVALQRQRTMSNPAVGKKPAAAAVAVDKVAVAAALLSNDKKSQRAVHDRKHKWSFDEIRPEFVDTLKEQALLCVSPAMHAKMFATDFKKHVEALSELTVAVKAQHVEAFQNADVLLKWTTIRLHEANMATLVKALEFCKALFSVIEEDRLLLSDYEASAFVPFLVNQIGNNQEKVRDTVHELFKTLAFIFPISKLIPFMLDGLKSKNARTRSESLDEMRQMLERGGIEMTGYTKSCPIVAVALTERDSKVREAAMAYMVAVYTVVGDEIWKCLQKIPDVAAEHLRAKFRLLAGGQIRPMTKLPSIRATQQFGSAPVQAAAVAVAAVAEADTESVVEDDDAGEAANATEAEQDFEEADAEEEPQDAEEEDAQYEEQSAVEEYVESEQMVDVAEANAAAVDEAADAPVEDETAVTVDELPEPEVAAAANSAQLSADETSSLRTILNAISKVSYDEELYSQLASFLDKHAMFDFDSFLIGFTKVSGFPDHVRSRLARYRGTKPTTVTQATSAADMLNRMRERNFPPVVAGKENSTPNIMVPEVMTTEKLQQRLAMATAQGPKTPGKRRPVEAMKSQISSMTGV